VPEPGQLGLFLLALVPLALRRRVGKWRSGSGVPKSSSSLLGVVAARQG
jgi:hypothetical protein